MTEPPTLKALAVYDTRPDAIKMAPVVAALARRPAAFQVRVCATGRPHRWQRPSQADQLQSKRESALLWAGRAQRNFVSALCIAVPDLGVVGGKSRRAAAAL